MANPVGGGEIRTIALRTMGYRGEDVILMNSGWSCDRPGGDGKRGVEMTKFVEWSDVLSVGIEEIDAQHRVLVDLVNQMHEAIHQHKGTAAVNEILGKLADYTRIHFAVEESLMRILDYPDYQTHKQHHEELVAEVRELQRKVNDEHKSISFELLQFLKKWLINHIIHEDKLYGPHFIAKGVVTHQKKSFIDRFWSRH